MFVLFFLLSFILCIHFVWTVAFVLTLLLSIMFVPEPCRVFLYERRPKIKRTKIMIIPRIEKERGVVNKCRIYI